MEDGPRRLQELLRDGLARPLQALSGEPPIWVVVAEQLTREIEAASKRDPQGHLFAPDQFTLSLHTIDARTLAGNTPNVQDSIARAIQGALQGARYSLARFPHVTLSADPTLRIGEARAIAWHSRDPLGSTPTTSAVPDEPQTPPAAAAFLIVDGKRHFRLDRALITIGRKLDNHLVLPDPHVSRRHAEIRQQGGRYMLRDLNSTSGTRVNGQLAMEHLLQPGDVITISGISLIYGEDPTGPPGATQAYTPPSMGRKDPNQVTPLNLRRPDFVRHASDGFRRGRGRPGRRFGRSELGVMKDQLAQVEKRLQTLVEHSLSRLAGGKLSPATVANQLAVGMIDGLVWGDDGSASAPDQYAIALHPKDVESLIEQAPDLGSDLSGALLEVARESGYAMPTAPHVTLAADPTLKRWEVRVVAWHSDTQLEFTQSGAPNDPTAGERLPAGAYLILHGQKHFSLDRALINVGRRLDNQLILDDPHVSRTHAQIRARDGRFVVFDLGSTGGTIVNGHRVHQHVLRPGDVTSAQVTAAPPADDASAGESPANRPPMDDG